MNSIIDLNISITFQGKNKPNEKVGRPTKVPKKVKPKFKSTKAVDAKKTVRLNLQRNDNPVEQ